jgi:lipopolysaccharide transport system ATP-binding protein
MIVISVENLWKQYRYGAISHATLRKDFESWWSRVRGKEDPNSRIGQVLSTKNQERRTKNEEIETDDRFWALRDINFEVKQGEVLGIIGRNGAGKSTLLKIMSKVTTPTKGEIKIKGRIASLLEVGTGFHPELTGRENIFLNGAILGMTKNEIRRKFDEIVAFAEVEKFIDTPVKRYSSGMYVRLAFAVAAHLEPEILIIDEVLAVGDAQFQKKCLGKMGEVAKGGRTVLFVSHNMAAVQQICTWAISLTNGNILEKGDVGNVVGHYLSASSATYSPVIDLSSHPARQKGMSPLFRQLIFRTPGGIPTVIFGPKDSLVAELTIDPINLIEEPKIALAIEDEYGRRITTVATYFQNVKVKNIETKSIIKVEIPELRLAPGRYLVSISIDSKYVGHVDALENVASFEVAWNCTNDNGVQYQPVFGPVLTSSTWDILPIL